MYGKVFAVLDTSFLIENVATLLNLLDELGSGAEERVSLVVPYVVIHELDNMKKSKSPTLSPRSINAMNMIEQSLLHSRNLICQTVLQRETEGPLPKNNDDQILDCALFYGRSSAAKVLLLTRDQNLALKALIHGIGTASELPSSVNDSYALIVEKASSIHDGYVMDWEASPAEISTDMGSRAQDQDLGALYISICGIVETSDLEPAIQAVLEQSIGVHWPALVKCPPSPWSTHFMIEFIDQNWGAVFAGTLPRSARMLSSVLHKRAGGDGKAPSTLPDTYLFARNLTQLLRFFGIDISVSLARLLGGDYQQYLTQYNSGTSA